MAKTRVINMLVFMRGRLYNIAINKSIKTVENDTHTHTAIDKYISYTKNVLAWLKLQLSCQMIWSKSRKNVKLSGTSPMAKRALIQRKRHNGMLSRKWITLIRSNIVHWPAFCLHLFRLSEFILSVLLLKRSPLPSLIKCFPAKTWRENDVKSKNIAIVWVQWIDNRFTSW